MANVEFQMTVNNKDEIFALLEEVEAKTLEEWGQYAEGCAMDLCPIDTGNLWNSISHIVDLDDHCVDMGTNVEYAVYVEFGTGKYAENGNGRPTPWAYRDDEGNLIWTAGQKPQPFIRPAIANHVDDYKDILMDNCLNA